MISRNKIVANEPRDKENSTSLFSDKTKVEFSLSRGSFATILLREIMKPTDPLAAGF